MKGERLVGLISDTHGLLRPEAVQALGGVELILHGGDVGGRAVIDGLERVAPVRAVRGNTDGRTEYRAALDLEFDAVRIHVSHGHEIGSPTPEGLVERYDADVIVYGHTHKPLIRRIGRTLVVNPGAAGPRRFNLKPSVAILRLPSLEAQIVEL